MNFIRPEVREAIWRWREVLFCGVLILWGVRMIGVGLERASVTQTFLGGVIVALFAVFMFWAILRAKMYKPLKGAGVVEVKEREVGYLSPDGGAFVSLDDLTKLEIVTNDRGPVEDDVFWVLSHNGGTPITFPASAKGSELLFDTFAALKGVDFEKAVRAMSSTQNARFLIWEKRVLH